MCEGGVGGVETRKIAADKRYIRKRPTRPPQIQEYPKTPYALNQFA